MRRRGSLVVGGDMWAVLGIAPTTDSIDIRRAYARRMKESDVGEDAEAFAELRAAREAALAWAAGADAQVVDDWRGAPLPAAEKAEAPAAPDDGGETPLAYGLTAPLLAGVDAADCVSTAAPVATTEPGISATPPIVRKATGTGDGPQLDIAQWAVPVLDVIPREDLVAPPTLATDDDYRALAALLFPDEGGDAGWMTSHEIKRWQVLLDRVFADPRMGELGYYGDVERWLGEVLAGSIPRSDSLLGAVADRFGWMAKADEVGEAPAIAQVTARIHALSFMEAVQAPGHRYRRAWRELATPADAASLRGWVGRKRVLELLQTIRQHHPQLEQTFDWYRVQLWEGDVGSRISMGLVIVLVVAGLNLVRIFYGDADRPPSQAPRPLVMTAPAEAPISVDLRAADADIEIAIDHVSRGMADGGKLAERNPDLHAALQRIWTEDKGSGVMRNGFERHVREHLNDRYFRIVGHASHADLVDNAQALLAVTRFLQNNPGECAGYFKGTTPHIPADLAGRRQTVFYRILMDTRGPMDPAAANDRFAVDHHLLERAAKRAGMPVADLVAALNGKGRPGPICSAHIALIEVAVEAPVKQGMKILPYL